MSYIVWIIAYNTSFLCGYLYIESTFFSMENASKACPPLLEAINANGLAVFLIANLLTGLVNVTVQTMYASKISSMAILHLYSIGFSGIAWLMRKKRIKL